MLACEVRASIGCALERVRGIRSRLTAVAPVEASLSASWGSVRGANMPTTACPERSRPTCGPSGLPTITIASATASCSAGTTVAPASEYDSSGKNAPAPAPVCTRTSCPADRSLATASGTSATLRSAGPVSLTTATFIGGPHMAGSSDAAAWPGQPCWPPLTQYGPYRLDECHLRGDAAALAFGIGLRNWR